MSKPCKICGGVERNKRNKCVACARKANRRWNRDNPEKRKEANRRWNKENSEKRVENVRLWQKSNPQKAVAKSRRWQRNNPGETQTIKHRYRALKENTYSENYDFKMICTHYNNQCVACGRSDLPLTVDHVTPLSKGGSDTPDNIQPLCGPCNSSKGNRHSTDYRLHFGKGEQ